MDYRIAYKDQNGKGMSKEYPWNYEVPVRNLELAKQQAGHFSDLGYKDVELFGIPEDFYTETLGVSKDFKMELIPWSFVKEHRIPWK